MFEVQTFTYCQRWEKRKIHCNPVFIQETKAAMEIPHKFYYQYSDLTLIPTLAFNSNKETSTVM